MSPVRTRSPASHDASLFAGLRTSDLATARPWYEQLLGEVAVAPSDRELVWDLSEMCSAYIEEDPPRAGGGLVFAMVDDIVDRLEQISGRGLEPATDETYGNGVRKTTFRDPEGNEFGFGAMHPA